MCCLICTFLSGGYSISNAQSVGIFTEPDSLFLIKQYDEALIAFERIHYFSSDGNIKTEALYRKAECLKQLKRFNDAERCLIRIDLSELKDSISYNIRYQMALCAYLGSHFTDAESYLTQLFFYLPDSNLTYHALPLYALVLNEEQKWKEAEQKLDLYISFLTKKDSLVHSITDLYTKKNIPKLKNLEKARLLSTLLPGTGQMYAGYFWEGVGSASAQVVCLAFTGVAIWQKYYISSLFVGYSTFFRFYQGGLLRVEYLVNKKNYELTRKYNDKLKNAITEIMEK